MKEHRWIIVTAAVLIALSAALYGAHYLLFHNYHHIFIYLVGDIAFVPLEVLLVVVVLERLLSRRERRKAMEKTNMLVGMFFNELGMELLRSLTEGLTNKHEVRQALSVEADWDARRHARAVAQARSMKYEFDAAAMDLSAIRNVLADRRDFLVLLMGNPTLIEHDRFSDLLWSVFHLHDELAARQSLDDLAPNDALHLAGDVRRVYKHLMVEWLQYCGHLKRKYPYIFSIVMRMHPLHDNPDATVA